MLLIKITKTLRNNKQRKQSKVKYKNKKNYGKEQKKKRTVRSQKFQE